MFLYTCISQNTIIVHSYEYGIYCIISTLKKNSRSLHYSFGCLIFGYFCLTSTLFFAFFSRLHLKHTYAQNLYPTVVFCFIYALWSNECPTGIPQG